MIMTDYIEKGHAKRIPEEELEVNDRPVRYLPHHPVTHPLKPDKVRVVYDCVAKYGGTSLNQQLLPGPDQTNQLIGVLSRFRQETVGVVADIEDMFHQVLVEPKDCDVLRFYASVAYLRFKDTSNQVHCAFVIGKARLAPLREILIGNPDWNLQLL